MRIVKGKVFPYKATDFPHVGQSKVETVFHFPSLVCSVPLPDQAKCAI
jgi:hypothetical protein